MNLPFSMPQIEWAKWAIYGLLFASVISLAELHGYSRGSQRLFEERAEQATKAVKVARARQVVTEKVVTRYIKVAGETQTVTNTISKEVVRYVETNPGRCLDVRWGQLHDAAAENVVPPAAIVAHGAAGAPTAAAAIETVTDNYAACHRTADRLQGLQDWVNGQLGVEED